MNIELMLQIALALISIIGALITYVLVPYIKARTTETQQQKIRTLVLIAVQAAEQIFNTPGAGQDKKAYVLQVLNQKGIQIDTTQLELLIEAAVFQLNRTKDLYMQEKIIARE